MPKGPLASTECPICLESFSDEHTLQLEREADLILKIKADDPRSEKMVAQLPCTHILHVKCLQRYLRHQNNKKLFARCSICRAQIGLLLINIPITSSQIRDLVNLPLGEEQILTLHRCGAFDANSFRVDGVCNLISQGFPLGIIIQLAFHGIVDRSKGDQDPYLLHGIINKDIPANRPGLYVSLSKMLSNWFGIINIRSYMEFLRENREKLGL
jgi:Zinc finger, C3HC4 type (RING finger)